MNRGSRGGKFGSKMATLLLEVLLELKQALTTYFYMICPPFYCESSFRRISGITNQKQTSEKTIDIVQPVSSSLRTRMDLTRQTSSLVGFFFAGRYPISTD